MSSFFSEGRALISFTYIIAYKVFLISTKAGGLGELYFLIHLHPSNSPLGINLTKASNVIICDSDWNPQVSKVLTL